MDDLLLLEQYHKQEPSTISVTIKRLEWSPCHNDTDFLQVGFVGVRGNEFSGDIALDDIVMTEGDCWNNNVLRSKEDQTNAR